jgi:hypothetical protein
MCDHMIPLNRVISESCLGWSVQFELNRFRTQSEVSEKNQSI